MQKSLIAGECESFCQLVMELGIEVPWHRVVIVFLSVAGNGVEWVEIQFG